MCSHSVKLDANVCIVVKACPKGVVHLRMLWHFVFMSHYKIKVMDEGNGDYMILD